MTGEKWTPAERRKFRSSLLLWFAVHRRDLPWRRTRDPYHIWVSEIMLQQTRVAAVLDHYAEFLRRFPTVAALAEAPEADVLAVWSGLGYYRRARMLRLGAHAVVKEYASVLPRTAAELLSLAGIGAYTSAAIASIAFGEAVAAVDGNVERVIMRVAGLAQSNAPVSSPVRVKDRGLPTRIRQLAQELLDREHPGDFNQAMMELGATLCLPRNPLCAQCPVVQLCQTRGEHPVKRRSPMVRQQIACALVVTTTPPHGTQVLLQQRPVEGTVMPGMWELPEIAAGNNAGVNRRIDAGIDAGIDTEIDAGALDAKSAEMTVRHAIMQTNYVVHVHAMNAKDLPRLQLNERAQSWVAPEALSRMPLTGLTRKILRRAGLLTHPSHLKKNNT